MHRCLAWLLSMLAVSQYAFGQQTFYAPQVILGDLGDRHYWSTSFLFVNPSPSNSVSVTITLMTSDGQPLNAFSIARVLGVYTSSETLNIGPLQSAKAVPVGSLVGPTTGWALIQTTGPVTSTIELDEVTGGCYVPSPGVCLGTMTLNRSATSESNAFGQDFVFAAQYAAAEPALPFGDAFGVALLNPSGNDPADITIQFLQSGQVINSVYLTLNPRQKLSKFLNELGVFPYAPSVGTVRILSTQPIGLQIIEVTAGMWIPVRPAAVQ